MRLNAILPLCLGAILAIGAVSLGYLVPAAVTPLRFVLGLSLLGFLAGLMLIAHGRPTGWATALAALTAIAYVSPGLAADGATPAAVAIPWGDWLAGAIAWGKDLIGLAVLGLFGLVLKRLPATLVQVLEAAQVEQLLKRAVEYAIGAVEGAAHGRTADVRVTNQVLAAALDYAIANGPQLAEKYADTLKAKLLARVSAAGIVPADASAAALGVALPS